MRQLKSWLLAAASIVLMTTPTLAANTSTFWWWQPGMKYSRVITPTTRANVQAVLDLAGPTPDGALYIQQSPGNLDADSTLWVHGNTTWKGAGKGISSITRTRFNGTDATNTGHVLVSAPYGMHEDNDQLSSGLPRDSLAMIHLEGLTLDGNYTAWPDSNPNTPGNFGLQFWYVDGPILQDFEVRNTLQTGIEWDACRNGLMDGVTTRSTGKQLQLGTRNGININNNSGSTNASVNWARRHLLKNIQILDHKDAALDIANHSEVTIDGMHAWSDHDTTFGNMVFEIEGSLSGYTMHDIHINNVTARGQNNQFFQDGITAANLERVTVTNSSFVQGNSTVDPTRARWALLMSNGRNRWTRDVTFDNCHFDSLNAGGAGPSGGAGRLAYIAGDTLGIGEEKYSGNFKILNSTFRGVNQAESNSSNIGLDITGNVDGVDVVNTKFFGVEDIGVFVHTNTPGRFVRNVYLENVYVDGSMQESFQIGGSSAGAMPSEINGVQLVKCVGKDANGDLDQASALVASITSGETVKNVWVDGLTLIRTSGTNMNGLRLHQSGSAVLDSIWILNNNLAGADAPTFEVVNSPTNVFYNDTGIRVRAPIIHALDSLTVTQIKPPSGGNVDILGTDGVLRGRFYGSGGLSITGSNAFYQLGGFTYLVDNGNDRRIVNKNAANAIHYRNAANTLDIHRVDDDGDTWVGSSLSIVDSLQVGGGARVSTILSNTATLDFDVSAVNCHDLTITVTGAATGDAVYIGVPNGSIVADATFTAWVSAANTVTVRACDGAGAGNPASGTFRATVVRH